ncbi:MAG: GTP cyclohydrolase I [bacterium]
MDEEKIREGVKLILEGIGENPDRPGLKETPDRVAHLYRELFSGVGYVAGGEEVHLFECSSSSAPIIVRGLWFHSMCEHHLLPFWGRVDVAYLPRDGKVIGFSDLSHLVKRLSGKPQLQEIFTEELADVLMETIRPEGLLVKVKATHMCMMLQGEKERSATATTLAYRGAMNQKENRQEVLALLK